MDGNHINHHPIEVILVHIIYHYPGCYQTENGCKTIFNRHFCRGEFLKDKCAGKHSDCSNSNPKGVCLPAPNVGLPFCFHIDVAVNSHYHIEELKKALCENFSRVAQIGKQNRANKCEKPAPYITFYIKECVEETADNCNRFDYAVGGPEVFTEKLFY